MLSKLTLSSAFLLSSLSTAQAQSLSESDVILIERLANVICIGLGEESTSSTLSIDADAAAEARVILRILGGAEGSIDVDGVISNYQNVPRDELSAKLASAQECRLEVYRSMLQEVSSAAQNNSQNDTKLIWTFPHVIRDNVAFGVINVKPQGGSGINANYRIRNLRSEPIYLKFAGSSYTDNNGNVCQRGSLTTSVSGIPWRSNDSPVRLPSGDSIQFSANNIRCDASGFSDGGDVMAIALVGAEQDSLSQLRFEIGGVEMAQ